MAKTSLEARLATALKLDDPTPKPYADMYAQLERVVRYLAEAIDDKRGKSSVVLEPGHLLNAGQQFNAVVYIPGRNQFRDTLFRAYIKPDGSSATLDFLGGVPETVRSAAALEDKVVEYLGRDSIRNMVRSLRDIVAKTP